MSLDHREAEIRRLRAALGVSAARARSTSVDDPTGRLLDEVRLIDAIVRAADPARADGRLLDIWLELRTRSTALAAHLPATEAAVEILRRQLDSER